MKTPQVPAMAGMAPLGYSVRIDEHGAQVRIPRAAVDLDGPLLNPLRQDQAEIARRKAAAPMLAPKPQVACDHGLFSDASAQSDLVAMVRGSK